jgi:hypothetical protein
MKIIHPTEDQLQRYSKDVLDAFRIPGVLGWHTPNGGYRDQATAHRMKECGVLPGVPDWIFIVGGEVKFLELKDHKGRLSQAQKDFRDAVVEQGFPYAIARSCDEIDAYMSAYDIINKSCTRVLTTRAA